MLRRVTCFPLYINKHEVTERTGETQDEKLISSLTRHESSDLRKCADQRVALRYVTRGCFCVSVFRRSWCCCGVLNAAKKKREKKMKAKKKKQNFISQAN